MGVPIVFDSKSEQRMAGVEPTKRKDLVGDYVVGQGHAGSPGSGGASPYLRRGSLPDQHAVSIAEKAVALLDRFPVRFENKLATGKRGNQHQERRFRKMKVGQQ